MTTHFSLPYHIDYRKIADAFEFYQQRGYTIIEVPWCVSRESSRMTSPPWGRFFPVDYGYLLASGEQGFIELMRSQGLSGKYVCCTPCFRHEEVFDGTHYPYFFKVELIHAESDSVDDMHRTLQDALEFMHTYIPELRVEQTDTAGEAFDIFDAQTGIELGSYGIRRIDGLCWVYGTGIALPRFDYVLLQHSS